MRPTRARGASSSGAMTLRPDDVSLHRVVHDFGCQHVRELVEVDDARSSQVVLDKAHGRFACHALAAVAGGVAQITAPDAGVLLYRSVAFEHNTNILQIEL